MFISGTGTDVGEDSHAVAVRATATAVNKLTTSEGTKLSPSVAIVFMSTNYDHQEALQGVRSVVGNVPIVGASTAGEINEYGPVAQQSITVMVIYSDTVTFSAVVTEHVATDSQEAGQRLAAQLKSACPEPKLVLTFADGLQGNGSALLRGIASVLGEQVPIAGGSAGDNGKLTQTFQFFGEAVYSDAVVALAIGGSVDFAIGVNHGWVPVGMPRTVTAADGNRLLTVDNQPAITLYETYLGPDEVANLKEHMLGEVALSYPLGIKTEADEEMLLRAPFAVDDDDGAITCGGEIQTGAEIQLMVGSKTDAVSAAKRAATSAKESLESAPAAALVFSCHVRNTLYASKEDARAETDAIQSVIGATTPLVGFYTYAEQAPVGGANRHIKACKPELYNETVVLVLLNEAH